ncbi:MAG: PTS sugar transporter subunit IIA [Syntrophales bacterium]|nr:PTS sugar transporter subunit IIA [Syntrophales bacterium]
MEIAEMLDRKCILDDMKAATKREVLYELSETLLSIAPDLDIDEVVNVLLEREKLGSTGIGDGIAIPHGKLSRLDRILLAFGRSKQGVDFNAMDGRPVRLFFLLLAPENSVGLHLKVLAKLSRMLKDESFRKELLSAPGSGDIYSIIKARDELS